MNEFEKIVGYEPVKKELKQISDSLKNSEKYKKLGVSAPKGLLLYGEPGLGKTLMASSLIEASGCKSFVCRKDKPNGEFINHIKATFEEAMKNEPSIVFLDDLDKFANGDEKHPDAEEYVTVQSCIDEAKEKEVFVIATVNNMRNLPSSLKRAGRFDRIIGLENPKGDDALLITSYYLGKIDFQLEVDVNVIGKIMSGHSCAELESIINSAGLYACYEDSEKITMNHFMKAYMKQIEDVDIDCMDTLCRGKNIDMNDGSSRVTQAIYHEAGHTVVSEVLSDDSVSFTCVYGDKRNVGGITSKYVASDIMLENLLINAVVSLAGKATTEQKFGLIDFGSVSDMNNTVRIVDDLITSRALCGNTFSDYAYGSNTESHKARQEIAITSEMEKMYLKAKEIIAKNWEFVEKVANALAEKGILVAEDIQKIKQECNVVKVYL